MRRRLERASSEAAGLDWPDGGRPSVDTKTSSDVSPLHSATTDQRRGSGGESSGPSLGLRSLATAAASVRSPSERLLRRTSATSMMDVRQMETGDSQRRDSSGGGPPAFLVELGRRLSRRGSAALLAEVGEARRDSVAFLHGLRRHSSITEEETDADDDDIVHHFRWWLSLVALFFFRFPEQLGTMGSESRIPFLLSRIIL